MTRAIDPDEELISDISLMIFDETGAAEDCFWLSGGERECTARLIMDKEYTFCACANFGYQVYADHIDELEEITFHMAYPDEYREGIPMYSMEKIRITEKPEVTLNLKRLMAKISLRIDRSRLDEDVEMHVRSVRIGNCPPNGECLYGKPCTGRRRLFPGRIHKRSIGGIRPQHKCKQRVE